MKRISFIAALLISFSVSSQAQTLEEADLLFSKKKYAEAATIYYQQYYFKKAANAYQLQTDAWTKAKKPQLKLVDSIKPFLNQSEKMARMLSHCENIQLIDSVIMNKNSFLKAYLTGEETGAFEQTNNTVVYENQLKDRRYFAKKDATGLFRLFSQSKMLDKWSEDKPLNIPSESAANDNFPFVMPDGLTIYFASTGNGSIGGYDLFVSRYNLNNDTYLAPSQMSMPFNSVYNDYMLVIDEVNGIGYFATDRFQSDNKVIIYTFIPNNEFKAIESDNERLLINRAKITSIRDTWLPNVNYRSQLEKIKANIAKKAQPQVKKDFTFVINDSIVYYVLTDFESDAAKKFYLQSKEMEEKIKAKETQLETQRKAFAEGDRIKKQSLRAPVLDNEQQLETLYQSYNKILMETRNTEIKYLRTKK
jgi:hypothetical protein